MTGKRRLATYVAVTLSSLKLSTSLQLRRPLFVRVATRSSAPSSSRRTIHQGSSPSTQEESERYDPLQEALRKSEERALDNFIEQEAPDWLQGRKGMPFECTACGRCCKTQGDVYMSPEEIQKASQVLGLKPNDFVHEYASHALGQSNDFDETTTWIRLREEGQSCVFLDGDGKCGIYEARPHQCRTYPFWPNLLKSAKSWDEECRRKDEDNESTLPPWTPVDGGCEGMKTIETLPMDGGSETDVPMREVYRQLFEYVTSDKRFPKDTERPLSPTNKQE